MVDRRMVGIACVCIMGMIATTAWCYRYGNPIWHGPKAGYLLVIPICLAFVTSVLLRRGEPFEEAPAALARWQMWRDGFFFPYCIIVTALEAVFILQASGIALPVGPRDSGRLGIIVISLVLVMAGNKLPKASLPPNGRNSLNVRETERFRQIQGRIIVAMGIVFILSACTLTLWWLIIVIFGITLVVNFTIRVMKSRLLSE